MRQRILIIGGGAVGQVFGANFYRAGHDVVFLVRSSQVDALREKGVTLISKTGDSFTVSGFSCVCAPPEREFDHILGCCRGDQAPELKGILNDMPGAREAILTLCFPAWRSGILAFTELCGGLLYLFPGLSAIRRVQGIDCRIRTTRIAPMTPADVPACNSLASILALAGLPARVDSRTLDFTQTGIALAFPFFLALSAKGYRYADGVRNGQLLRLANHAQKETLAILQAQGVDTGRMGKVFTLMPPGLFAMVCRASDMFLRGFDREMMEVHFHKVDRQAHVLLAELAACPEANSIPHPHLDALLEQCP